MVTVSNCLAYLKEKEYPQLFSRECMIRLDNVEKKFGEIETEETILEVLLDKEVRTCDYSIKVLTENKEVSEYWYELDYEAIAEEEIKPCYFIDASALKPEADCESFYGKVLPQLAGEKRAGALLPMLRRCVAAMKGRCVSAYQLGAMSGRGQDDRLRFFTMEMTKDSLLSYLEELGWEGNVIKLDQMLTQFEPFSLRKHFILDFDITADGISRKIGINFGPSTLRKGAVREWLSFLKKEGLCLPSKEKDILRWIERFPSHTPFIQNDISHFKLPFDGEKLLTAKAYLRQGSRVMNTDFRAYDTPVLMNLELTTRCPLRCPQCYCELTGGKDLKLDTALYFIEEAAACHVQTVNLSGGETLCYPHLTKLVERCHELGMMPNIAVSGYGITREKLEELIQAGVYNICVSLNGSREEINRKTRDGYALAVDTLALLKEQGFPRTVINWVMHQSNAEDFPELVKLAEEYHVSEIAVMVFKPDAAHQLPSVPTGEQMKKVAAFIKGYKGTVKIEAEECFSQMRALLGERFLMNRNTGIARGCGAGRDGISITVDGRITPCRHLEFAENNLSIRDYWENSQVVQELRRVEDKIEEPCSECRYRKNCLPCMAVNVKLHDRIAMGMAECPLADKKGQTEGKQQKEQAEDELILVNYRDEVTGYGRKLSVHQKGLLHRAFSIFIFRNNELLIQKRAAAKYHCAGLYANTCCSHPHRGENLVDATERRLYEEAGIRCQITEVSSFIYRAPFDNGLTEYELDHIFIGEYDGEYKCNHEEAEEMKYVDIDRLLTDMEQNPGAYAPWFITALPIALRKRNH